MVIPIKYVELSELGIYSLALAIDAYTVHAII